MRGWFGPVGKCGCCGGDDPPDPLPCACPEGGLAMSFDGTPTLVVTVSGMPSSYAWESIYRYDPPIGGGSQWRWESTSLSGLDLLNGTYAWELPKAANGCIQHPANIPSGRNFIFANMIPMTMIVRNLSGDTGCVASSTNTVNLNVFTTLQASLGPANPASDTAGRVSVSLSIAYTYGGTAGTARFSIFARQWLHCGFNYDPSLTPGSDPVGALPITSDTPRPNSSTEIWIARGGNATDRCIPPAAFDYEVLGNMAAEIIDDVP